MADDNYVQTAIMPPKNIELDRLPAKRDVDNRQIPKVTGRVPSKHIRLNAGMIIGNSSVGEWFKKYSDAAWQVTQHPSPSGGVPDKIIDDAVKQAGGRGTPLGAALFIGFNVVKRYINELRGEMREYLRGYSQYSGLIEESVKYVLGLTAERVANGIVPDNAGGTLRFYLQPYIDSAVRQDEAQRQAEVARAQELTRIANQRTQAQIGDIKNFWSLKTENVDNFWSPRTGFNKQQGHFLTTGEFIFSNVEEMQKYCPAGRYVASPGGYHLVQDGEISNVYLMQSDGRIRKVAFLGPTWMFEDDVREEDRAPLERGLLPNVHRYVNSYWSEDPDVIATRAAGAVQLRKHRELPPVEF
ncbi:hypothetical protein [Burkholderia territorii]|uniref:hypothetical protein n=1 Tax=Burkholderia territorii TaxID=1503055 RepID=UPI0012D88E42|nr:hypothetical protein [Burkholderia territorii]